LIPLIEYAAVREIVETRGGGRSGQTVSGTPGGARMRLLASRADLGRRFSSTSSAQGKAMLA